MKPLNLVSLDFDGTVMVYPDPTGVFHPNVIEALNALKPLGIRWCTNSGRSYDDQLLVLARCIAAGLTHLPDALICSESFVYVRDGAEFRPLESWNQRAEQLLAECRDRTQKVLEPHLPRLNKKFPELAVVDDPLFTALLIPELDGYPTALYREIRQILVEVPGTYISRNGGWVVILHEAVGKGPALSAFARFKGIEPDQILAIGDHYNDLTMLDGTHARRVGCPGDAIAEIQETVRRANGYVAQAGGPEGTLEVLRHYLPQTPCEINQ